MGFPVSSGKSSFFVMCNKCLTFCGPHVLIFKNMVPFSSTILNSTGSSQGDKFNWLFALIHTCMEFIAFALSFVEKIAV